MDICYGWMEMGGGMWRYILRVWGWVDIFYGLVQMVGLYFSWVGESGHFLWLGADGWGYILGGWA